MSLIVALAAVPGLMGTQEAIRQGQQKERREEHRARRCNLVARCIKSSVRSREINGRPLVLRNGAVLIDTCTSEGTAPEHQLAGYFLPYPDTQYEGHVTTITDVAPVMNWLYVHRSFHQLRYGVRVDAQPNLPGPFDCTRQDRRLTFDGWEGFCAAEILPGIWGVFFDIDDDGLKGKMREGIIAEGTPVLEIELCRVEKRWKKDMTARTVDQTINRGNELDPNNNEVIKDLNGKPSLDEKTNDRRGEKTSDADHKGLNGKVNGNTNGHSNNKRGANVIDQSNPDPKESETSKSADRRQTQAIFNDSPHPKPSTQTMPATEWTTTSTPRSSSPNSNHSTTLRAQQSMQRIHEASKRVRQAAQRVEHVCYSPPSTPIQTSMGSYDFPMPPASPRNSSPRSKASPKTIQSPPTTLVKVEAPVVLSTHALRSHPPKPQERLSETSIERETPGTPVDYSQLISFTPPSPVILRRIEAFDEWSSIEEQTSSGMKNIFRALGKGSMRRSSKMGDDQSGVMDKKGGQETRGRDMTRKWFGLSKKTNQKEDETTTATDIGRGTRDEKNANLLRNQGVADDPHDSHQEESPPPPSTGSRTPIVAWVRRSLSAARPDPTRFASTQQRKRAESHASTAKVSVTGQISRDNHQFSAVQDHPLDKKALALPKRTQDHQRRRPPPAHNNSNLQRNARQSIDSASRPELKKGFWGRHSLEGIRSRGSFDGSRRAQ